MKIKKPLPTPPGPRLAKYDNAEGVLIYIVGMALVISLILFAAFKILIPVIYN